VQEAPVAVQMDMNVINVKERDYVALHKPEHKTWQYWVKWPFLAAAFAVVFPFCLLIFGYQWTRDGWLRDWENYIDDPVDFVKEWLHCAELPFGFYLNISFLMANRKTTWNIITRCIDKVECDPEDELWM
jgi:hypothetical protein